MNCTRVPHDPWPMQLVRWEGYKQLLVTQMHFVDAFYAIAQVTVGFWSFGCILRRLGIGNRTPHSCRGRRHLFPLVENRWRKHTYSTVHNCIHKPVVQSRSKALALAWRVSDTGRVVLHFNSALLHSLQIHHIANAYLLILSMKRALLHLKNVHV